MVKEAFYPGRISLFLLFPTHIYSYLWYYEYCLSLSLSSLHLHLRVNEWGNGDVQWCPFQGEFIGETEKGGVGCGIPWLLSFGCLALHCNMQHWIDLGHHPIGSWCSGKLNQNQISLATTTTTWWPAGPPAKIPQQLTPKSMAKISVVTKISLLWKWRHFQMLLHNQINTNSIYNLFQQKRWWT